MVALGTQTDAVTPHEQSTCTAGCGHGTRRVRAIVVNGFRGEALDSIRAIHLEYTAMEVFLR